MIKFIEKKVPEGLDLIVVILIAPALVYGLATLINPGVTAVQMRMPLIQLEIAVHTHSRLF